MAIIVYVMKTQLTAIAAVAAVAALAGCQADPAASAPTTPSGSPAAVATVAAAASTSPATDQSTTAATPTPSPTQSTKSSSTSKSSSSHSSPSWSSSTSSTPGTRIVYFELAQKPKCAEGTAVFRAAAVPAIIKWKIEGGTAALLSVDDNTHTPGTYGSEDLSGSLSFDFSCLGPVGSTEKHTYTIYTSGPGKQHSLTITASAKVLDDGKN